MNYPTAYNCYFNGLYEYFLFSSINLIDISTKKIIKVIIIIVEIFLIISFLFSKYFCMKIESGKKIIIKNK